MTPEALQHALDAVVVVETGASYCAGARIRDEARDGAGAGAAAGSAGGAVDLIVTAYHCVADGGRPHVRWRDGETVVGRVVGRSPGDDLALIEVVGGHAGGEGAAARHAALALRSDAVVQGEEVWGLGHPFGLEAGGKLAGLLEWSVSHGVVSAAGAHLVQTDAALNPGNSGGPLVDGEGRLVGVVSRKLRADNLAFVSPAANVRALVEELAAARRGAERAGAERAGGGQAGAERAGAVGPPLGGSLGLGLVLAAEQETWAGLEASLCLRDRVIWTGGLGFAPGDNWAAHGELDVSLRQRLGTGGFTGVVSVGPGLTWDGSVAPAGAWLDGQLDPAFVGRVGFNQLQFGLWWHPLAPRVGLTVSLAWPGRLAVF